MEHTTYFKRCPALLPLPANDSKTLAQPGREMDFYTVLLIMGLEPEKAYTLGEIGVEKKTYHRLYAYVNNRSIEPDGKKEVSGKLVSLYFGATLMNALPELSRFRHYAYRLAVAQIEQERKKETQSFCYFVLSLYAWFPALLRAFIPWVHGHHDLTAIIVLTVVLPFQICHMRSKKPC